MAVFARPTAQDLAFHAAGVLLNHGCHHVADDDADSGDDDDADDHDVGDNDDADDDEHK